MKVFNRIATLRKKARLSQSQLASFLGINRRYISFFESQKIQPSLYDCFALFDVFNCSFDDLFYLSSEEDI